jgi:hypothetical protein
VTVQYKRDDAKRCIRLTFGGTIGADDAAAAREEFAADAGKGYGVLCDLRSVTPSADLDRLLQQMMQGRTAISTDHRPGPIAVVASNGSIHALACAYAELRRPLMTVAVFRHADEAEEWLRRELRPQS